MDKEQEKIVNTLIQYRDALESKNKLKAILFDCIPDHRGKVHVMLNAYDEGIIDAFKSGMAPNNIEYRYIQLLENNYGISADNTKWAVETWKNIVDDVIGIEIKKEDVEEEHRLFRPGGRIATRKIRFYFMINISKSMAGEKIESINKGMKNLLKDIKKYSESEVEYPFLDIYVSVMALSENGAYWLIKDERIMECEWLDLKVGNSVVSYKNTFDLLIEDFKSYKPNEIALPPVIALITDSVNAEFSAELEKIKANPWFRKSVRISYVFSDTHDTDRFVEFTGNNEFIMNVDMMDKITCLLKYPS